MKSSIYALAMLSASTFAAHAAPNDGIVGPYARVEVGVSNFSLSGLLKWTPSSRQTCWQFKLHSISRSWTALPRYLHFVSLTHSQH